jgi:hypothetical protein
VEVPETDAMFASNWIGSIDISHPPTSPPWAMTLHRSFRSDECST